MVRYTFGDDDPAVQRLALVHQAYAPHSTAFVLEHVRELRGAVLDLGCGPGFTTRMLSDLLDPHRIVGIDTSADFLRAAAARVPTARFHRHDATLSPLPERPYDVIYARLLLAHLGDPRAAVEQWRTELAPGGVVLVEDLEDIEAPEGPLRDYDELAAETVRRGGGVMMGGAALAGLDGALDGAARIARVTVPASTAARIYLFNVRRWLTINTTWPHDRLVELERGLEALVAPPADRSQPPRRTGGTVSWVVRQLAVGG